MILIPHCGKCSSITNEIELETVINRVSPKPLREETANVMWKPTQLLLSFFFFCWEYLVIRSDKFKENVFMQLK